MKTLLHDLGPTCGKCRKVMTPQNSTACPEYFLCDDCAKEHGFEPRINLTTQQHERLRKECGTSKLDLEAIRKAAHECDNQNMLQVEAILDTQINLCDEVERLRQALQEIVDLNKITGRYDMTMAIIAAKALGD